MREKLLDLMKNEGLKPSQLAELLGINPAGVSHILAGRNKPGFDLLQKILRRFPRISPDWLLLDSGSMYRSETGNFPQISESATTAQTGPTAENLFSRALSGEIPVGISPDKATPDNDKLVNMDAGTTFTPGKRSTVNRVIILYDDATFESFTPGKK